MFRNILHIIEYLLFVAVSILLLVFFHNYYTFFLLVFLVFFPFLAIALEYYVLKRLECFLILSKKTAHVGEETSVSVQLKNPTWIPLLDCSVMLHIKNHFYPESESIQVKIPAVAKQTTTVSFPLRSAWNGNLLLSLTKLTVHDMLDFTTFKRALSVNQTLAILPVPFKDIPNLNRKNTRINGSDEIQDSVRIGTSTDTNDIREYIPGDRLQHIHWKLSAKQDNLLVKEFKSSDESAICFVFELYQSQQLSDVMNMIDALCLKHLSLNEIVWINWWSVSKNAMQSKCLHSKNEIEQVLLSIYHDDSYAEESLAHENFQAYTIGFSSYYYLKMITNPSQEERSILIVYEEE